MNNEEEKVINSTILNTGVAKPISVSKEEALKIASEQKQVITPNQTNIAKPMPISKDKSRNKRLMN